jgi:hypothetical protein
LPWLWVVIDQREFLRSGVAAGGEAVVVGWRRVDRSGRRRRLFSTKAKWEKAAGRLRLARVLGLELIGRAAASGWRGEEC